MKPPPRARTKPARRSRSEAPARDRQAGRKWLRPELQKLLRGLKILSRRCGGLEEVDYDMLAKRIPTRSISDIKVMVESLKKRVISSARSQLNMRTWEEKQSRKAIGEWTDMASALVGTLETVISAAFCQMLIVSSTEPCTLVNSAPYQKHEATVGRAKPSRAGPRIPAKGVDPVAVPSDMLLITPVACMSRNVRLPAPSKVVKVKTSKILSLQKRASHTADTANSQMGRPDTLKVSPADQTARLLSEKAPPSPSSTSSQPLASSASDLCSVPSATQSTVASCSLPVPSDSSSHSTVPLCSTATGQTSKSATTEENPETFSGKFAVDFEKIYKFLSAIQKPSQDFQLTPMESAIILDLLMCLPEELSYLDCKKLHRHLIQMHQCMSASVHSKPAKELLSKLKNAHLAQRAPPTAETSGSSADTGSMGQSKDADTSDFIPPLNPFMVPLNLLMRRLSSG